MIDLIHKYVTEPLNGKVIPKLKKATEKINPIEHEGDFYYFYLFQILYNRIAYPIAYNKYGFSTVSTSTKYIVERIERVLFETGRDKKIDWAIENFLLDEKDVKDINEKNSIQEIENKKKKMFNDSVAEILKLVENVLVSPKVIKLISKTNLINYLSQDGTAKVAELAFLYALIKRKERNQFIVNYSPVKRVTDLEKVLIKQCSGWRSTQHFS